MTRRHFHEGDPFARRIRSFTENAGSNIEAATQADVDAIMRHHPLTEWSGNATVPFGVDLLIRRHMRHYQSCSCLDDSDICCDPTCPCHGQQQKEKPMTRILHSRAGKPIEIIPDDELAELYELVPEDLRQATKRLPLLATLWNEGDYSDPKGFATKPFYEDARSKWGYQSEITAISSMLRGSTMAVLIERKLKGKRCYSIRLARLPESYVGRVREYRKTPFGEQYVPSPERPPVLAMDSTQVASKPAPLPDLSEYTEPEVQPSISEDTAAAVARQLLAECVRVIGLGPSGDKAHELESKLEVLSKQNGEASLRLHEQIEYGNKLRRQLGETGEELAAVKLERDGLRTRLRQAEANLATALGSDGRRFVDEQVRKELERVMRATPQHKAEGDEQ